MDFFSFVRTLGALAFVLGLLVAGLWLVRRYDLRLPTELFPRLGAGLGRPQRERRLELVERLALDTRRALVLVRRDGVEFTLLLAPEGLQVLEPGQACPVPPPAEPAPATQIAAQEEANLA